MSAMVMEVESVPVTASVQAFLTGSGAFPPLAALNGSTKSALGPRSNDPTVHANLAFDGDGAHGEFLTFDKRDAAELEFLLQSHLVILLPDGISGGCEWSNGSETWTLPSVAPNTILFNPARDYL